MDSFTRSHNAILIAKASDISLKALRYKYPTRKAITLEAEIRQISVAVKQGFKRLRLGRIKQEALSVVGYGPSLAETWKDITHPCISTSGAHDFLIERGFIPDFHAQCDGRDHQAAFLEHPHHDITYVMASICAEGVWEKLRGHKVLLWHNCNGEHVIDWIGKNDPNTILVAGGSNVGLSAIHVGGIMGYRKFRIFGFDGNFRGKVRHAGKHPDPEPQKMIRKKIGGRTWFTSPQMYNACQEFIVLSRNDGLDFHVYGTSLLTSLLDDDCLSAISFSE